MLMNHDATVAFAEIIEFGEPVDQREHYISLTRSLNDGVIGAASMCSVELIFVF